MNDERFKPSKDILNLDGFQCKSVKRGFQIFTLFSITECNVVFKAFAFKKIVNLNINALHLKEYLN